MSPVEHRHRLGGDDRAGIDTLVDVVDGRGRRGSAGREHVLERMSPGEVRQRRGMHIHDALRKAIEERGSKQVHVSGADHELDIVPASQSAMAASRASRSE